MQTLRSVVCGTDFSACAEQALQVAIQLAHAADARLTLVHVYEPGEGDLDDLGLLECDQALSRIVDEHRSRGVEIAGLLRRGKPWEKLDNAAAEVGASLIVIGRHGSGRCRSAETGSVADRLVHAANRSVLTVACSFDCWGGDAPINHRQH